MRSGELFRSPAAASSDRGPIASRNGKATDTPRPLKTVRRDNRPR